MTGQNDRVSKQLKQLRAKLRATNERLDKLEARLAPEAKRGPTDLLLEKATALIANKKIRSQNGLLAQQCDALTREVTRALDAIKGGKPAGALMARQKLRQFVMSLETLTKPTLSNSP